MRFIKSLLGGAVLSLLAAFNATAADTGKVVFGHAPPGGSLQTAQIVIALDRGLFKQAGLEVEVVRFPTGRRGLEAILGGQVDLAFMAEYPPVIAALQKQNFAIVTQLAKFTGNRLISTSDAGFTSVKDLAGKRIGTTVGSNSEFFTQVLLDKAGIKAEIVNLAPADIIPALDRRDIDAGVPFPDHYDKAREVLGARYREVLSRDYDAHMVVSASRAFIADRPGDLRKFLTALVQANDVIRNDPAAAKAIILKGAEGALNAATIERFWPEYVFRLGFEHGLLDLIEAEAKWVDGKGLIKGAVVDRAALRQYLADGPIKAIAPDSVDALDQR